VVDKFLMQLEEQLHEKKVEAIFTDNLRKFLAKKGFDPLMGARPMARLIQDMIRKALADELLFGKLVAGGRVTVDLDDKESHPTEMLNLHEDVVEEGADGDEPTEVRERLHIPGDPDQRKKFFLEEANRKAFIFEKGRVYFVDFGNPYIGFSDFSLRLPGFSLQVAKYIDEKNHKLRYTLKNRHTNETYLVVLFTLLLYNSKEEIEERDSDSVSSRSSSQSSRSSRSRSRSSDKAKEKTGKQGPLNREKPPDDDEGVD